MHSQYERAVGRLIFLAMVGFATGFGVAAFIATGI